MGIGDNILLVSCLAGLMLAMPSMLIFLNLALLGTSNRATARLSEGGCVPFAVGIGVLLACGIPSGIMLSIGSVPQGIGAVTSLLILFVGFIGLAVVARLVGQRFVAMYEQEESPLVQTLAGSFILSFSIAFPLIGWFIIFPFSLITGMGAVVIVLAGGFFGGNWRRRRNTQPAQPLPVLYEQPPQMPPQPQTYYDQQAQEQY